MMKESLQHNGIEPAQRVKDVKEYYFSRKLREVDEMRKAGHDVISLGIGGPDRAPAPEVIETLSAEAHNPKSHSYQSYTGLPELRKAYSEWYKRYFQVDLDPDNEILPLIGSKEGILHVSLAFLNPGDGVLVPDPGYPTYTSVSNLAGATVHKYHLKPENGWYPDLEELEKLPLKDVKLMWINYPHMPTGTRANSEVFEKIIDFGKRHNIVIAHDNPYSFILNDNPSSILAVEGAKDIAVELNSLSKSHNMAGWRLGMVATNPVFLNWILKVKSNIDSGQFKPVMLAAVKALQADGQWYAELNDVYGRRRKIAELIADRLGCVYDKNQIGLFLWARIPDEAENSEKFADAILHRHNIFLTPGFIFGREGDRYIRISLCATEERMKEAYDRLEKK